MRLSPNSTSTTVVRLLAVLMLLGWAQITSAAGTWSVIPLPRQSGEVISPNALAVDAAGYLYVAGSDIERRDAQGNWSTIATQGTDLGQVSLSYNSGIAVDGRGNLYVADTGNNRVQEYSPAPGP